MPSNRHTKRSGPLDPDTLYPLALSYVGRYATSCARLAAYLERKIRERGWVGSGEPDVTAIVARCAQLGFVDDRSFAQGRAAALARRGLGSRRIAHALRGAGIDDAIAETLVPDEAAAQAAAHRFARRRRIGIYADTPVDLPTRRRHLAAMLRAGHSFDLAKRIVDAVASDAEDVPFDWPG